MAGMKKWFLITTVILLLSNSLLTACGSVLTPTPTGTPIPTLTPTQTATPPPTSTHTPAPTGTPTSIARNLPLSCDADALVPVGEYQVQMDTWGRGTLTGWSQCISGGTNPDGTIVARWTWNWLNSGGNVKSFPAIVFGKIPSAPTTAGIMPIRINTISSVSVSYDITSTHTGTGNLILHMWLTNTQDPSTWGVPPITHEVIICLEVYGDMNPAVPRIKEVDIGNDHYDLYTGDNFGMGWRFIVFQRVPYTQGPGTLDLMDFLSIAQKEGYITGSEYLASISFGNEVVSGAGETIVNRYVVSVRSK